MKSKISDVVEKVIAGSDLVLYIRLFLSCQPDGVDSSGFFSSFEKKETQLVALIDCLGIFNCILYGSPAQDIHFPILDFSHREFTDGLNSAGVIRTL